MAELNVQFTDEIPKIERQGFTRESKYTPLLDACVERPGKAARIEVDTQGQASSRASSIRDAAEKHSAVTDGIGHFKVATRSGDNEKQFFVYVQYNEGPDPDAEEESETKSEKPKAKKKARKTKAE